MRELFQFMFVPEYSITPKVLKNIATIEYSKAVVENTTILPSWENQLKKEAKIKILFYSLQSLGLNMDHLKVKEFVDDMDSSPPMEFINLKSALSLIDDFSKNSEIGENEINQINKVISQKSGYRGTKISGKANPEELLAHVVQFFDWHQSLDAKETHPIITAAITKAYLESLELFKVGNEITANLVTYLCLKSLGYSFKDYLCLEDYFQKTKRQYEEMLKTLSEKNPDYTGWLEYFTEGLAIELTRIKEKVQRLSIVIHLKEKLGGKQVFLSERQITMMEYIQRVGYVQNQTFKDIFPKISEDTILRDLHDLMKKGIIKKEGKTKAARYTLK